MQRQLLLIALCLVTAFSLGCTKEGQKSSNSPLKMGSPHGAGTDTKPSDQPQGFIGIVTSQKLPLSNTKTIGTAFGEYRHFNSREWKETRNTDGKAYVDFIGYLANAPSNASSKDGVSRQGVEVKFVVEPNGNFYLGMVSRVDVKADGKMHLSPLENGKTIVELIYSNKEITF